MVPNDWTLEKLANICSKITDGAHHSPKSVSNGYPMYSVKDMTPGGFHADSARHISEADFLALERQNCKPLLNDILIAKDGSILKYCFVVEKEIEGVILSSIALLRPKLRVVEPKYISHYFSQEWVKFYVVKALTSGSGVPRIILKDFKSIKIPLPPLSEQRKIAKILSTWDKAINATERLIDNRKQQKKALMQQLLTGKKRLLDDSGKPFSGEWEWVALEEICDVKGGKRLPKGKTLSDSPTPHPYIRVADMYMGGINQSEIKYVPIEVAAAIKNYRVTKDDLFITVAGTLGLVGEIPPELDGANLTENADKLTNIRCNKRFLLYIMKSSIIQSYIEAESTQNAQPKLALARIRSFKIPRPNSDEQKKIADVLTNADKEIELLEQQLADLKEEKKALNQQLLTGKRRVKVDEKEVA